jgi:FtsP/CotA-like multicopper oxidase with cupredoxin domain
MSLTVASSALAANSEFLPTFEKELLTPTSQLQNGNAWTNTTVNALASYYTYIPYNNADAVALGFPAICGNPSVATVPVVPATVPPTFTVAPLDAASTADCYTISVRQLVQPTSLDFLKYVGIPGFPGKGLISKDGLNPLVDTSSASPAGLLAAAAAGKLTYAWGYGSGGTNWQPNFPAGPVVRGNAPSAFQTVPFNSLFGAGINGDPTATGVWHFPAPTIKGTTGRQVLVQWKNELHNVKPYGHDPTVDCGDIATNCYPYNRQVVHVHGAHVGPESDGLAVSWYTPNFILQGEGAFPKAGIPGAMTGAHAYYDAQGNPIYQYPLTQPASTIWYHDHAVGTTHMNTEMGMAGFFPVTDDFEKHLQGIATPAFPTAGPLTKVLPTGDVFEVGFALQDRHFDVNGQMAFPSVATYDKTDPNCVFDINNNAVPGTCARLNFMKKITAATVTDPTPAVHFIPYKVGAPELNKILDPASYALNFPTGCKVNTTNAFEGISGVDAVDGSRIPFTQCAPFPAASATLEYFGNMPVVNGVTFPVYDVQPTVYRMRFIGGTDSRTWITQLTKEGAVPNKMNCGIPQGCDVYDAQDIIPFYQVGSEQGLLPAMVKRNEIDMMPGERFDVLVDFSGLGGTTVTMKNLGDDAPFSGRFDFDNLAVRQPTSVSIPEIMKFRVAAATVPATTSGVPAPAAGTPLTGITIPALVATNAKPRVLALAEITDQYGRTMPTIDARGYIPPGIRTTEVIPQNAIEMWDIVNTTVDAHPMHIHQVAFQTLMRQAVDVGVAASGPGVKLGANHTFGAETSIDPLNPAHRAASVFSETQYVTTPGSLPMPIPAYEQGWKDSIAAYPGYVVRVIAKYDLLGDYVWHCHILSHEEHDMMRPFRVTSAAALAAPATVFASPVINGSTTVAIAPVPAAPVGTQYVLQYKKNGATYWETNAASTPNQTLNLVALGGAGSYHFRAQAIEPALQNHNSNTMVDSAWTTGNTVNFNNVTITTASPLPSYTLGSAAFAPFTFAKDGGIAPYTWTVSAGLLPDGLTLSPAGVLSGQPLFANTFSFSVTVTDGHVPAQSSTVAYTMDVLAAPAIVFANATLPTQVLGLGAYGPVTVAATGGIAPFTYAVTSGTLPAGLTLSTAGVISGTPTAIINSTFNITATDSAVPTGNTMPATFSINITAPAALAITTTSPLAAATQGTLMTPVQFAATGGVGTKTWTVPVGLPAGLTMSPTGLLSGTPTVNGPFGFFVTVADSTLPTPVTSSAIFIINIAPAAVIPPVVINTIPVAPTVLATVTVGTAIAPITFTATGGTNPLAYSVAGQPAGLIINSVTGVLSGTPTTAGPVTFTVTATDSTPVTPLTNTATYVIVVNPAPLPVAVAPIVFANGAVNALYTGPTPVATGGTGPYTWTAIGLPVGYSINPTTGVISGTTTFTAGTFTNYSITVTARDTLLATASAGAVLRVNQTAPAAPSLLAATIVAGKPVLTWTDNSNNEIGNMIQRATDALFTVGLTTTYQYIINSTTYTDATAAPLTTYFYRVKALNNLTLSPTFSNTFSVTTP